MGRLSARERIINFFLGISAQRKKIGLEENPISLPMSRSDIADYLGLTVETISREITKLKSEKIINMINSRQVFLNNKDTLEIQHLNNTTSY
jgi:CRP/FNR family transcriptional regulator